MRRADNQKPIVIIGITAVATLMAGASICALILLNPFGKGKIVEGKTVEVKKAQTADTEITGSKAIEITTPTQNTLNQEEKSSKISASRQSSLEKAIDDLIELTESDG